MSDGVSPIERDESHNVRMLWFWSEGSNNNDNRTEISVFNDHQGCFKDYHIGELKCQDTADTAVIGVSCPT